MAGTQLNVTPGLTSIATSETLAPAFDYTPVLTVGQAITAASSVLTDTTTATTVVLADTPTFAAGVVTQIIRGTALTGGHNYRLVVTATIAPTEVMSAELDIVCPY